jgi:AAA15 family ATPase/GTPase
MLCRLSVQNFLSIDKPIDFSMIATKESQHASRVALSEDWPVKLLQVAAVWGGNASGKSNFTKALRFAKFMVVTGTRPDAPIGRVPFKLRSGSADEPSRFVFELLVEAEGEERFFRYVFAVTNREVIEESLVELRTASEKVYFTRRAPEDGKGDHIFSLDWWDRRSVVSEDDKQFARFIAKGTQANQLFLHEAMDRKLELLAPVFRWFRDQLIILEPDADHFSLETLHDNRPELREFVAMMLNHADTGVHTIAAERVSLESIGLSPKMREMYMAQMKEGGAGILVRSSMGHRFSLFLHKGELVASRLVTYRNSKEGTSVPFETNEESDGTLRLFDLSPVFYDLSGPSTRKTYVIDELDRSMHTQLCEALLESYFEGRTPESRSQMIFTTHEVELLDQSLLRRDEVWFIEHDEYGECRLQRLSDYKDVRHDKDIRKAYLEGKFAGVPHLRPFRRRKTATVEVQEAEPEND